MVIDIEVFSAAESAAISDRLEALRPTWLHRQPGFATYGVATYLDVMCSEHPEETYYARLGEWNARLASEFGEELECVRAALSRHLQAPARFEPAVALPGFHVFEDSGICTTDRPSMHFDLQHRSLRWPFGPVTDDVISFTLSLRLPRLGGALDVWDVTEADLARLERMGRRTSMEQLARLKPVRRHEYGVGSMAVQLRPLMHRIAAVPQRFPGDQRITLQGHGVRDGGTWVLYW